MGFYLTALIMLLTPLSWFYLRLPENVPEIHAGGTVRVEDLRIGGGTFLEAWSLAIEKFSTGNVHGFLYLMFTSAVFNIALITLVPVKTVKTVAGSNEETHRNRGR